MSQINNLNDIDEQSDSDSTQLQTSSVLNFENNEDIAEDAYETDLTQDSVKTYLAEIGKNSLLKQKEEKQLAMELEISEELSAFFSDSLERFEDFCYHYLFPFYVWVLRDRKFRGLSFVISNSSLSDTSESSEFEAY